ncbi:hypothetical protein BDN71DRAFT_1513707 [Pleurotus eryngii]|uniref:Uncharacterized protein n=1 Tax=Pleurotus eryngii TaxID=5323 RepID=A0A9P5ZG96_PLEER|nr:hypothetical protein BDN71DRAFT_1513707 [Pleurotus eryngii]
MAKKKQGSTATHIDTGTSQGDSTGKAKGTSTPKVPDNTTVEALPLKNSVEPQPTRLQTRKSNQHQHPGDHHNRYSTRRRTKEEIAQDELVKAKKLLDEKKQSIQDHQSRIKIAAQLESDAHQRQKATELAATRPDLAPLDAALRADYVDEPDEWLLDGPGLGNLPYTSGDDSEHLSILGEHEVGAYDEDFDNRKGTDPDYVEQDEAVASKSDLEGEVKSSTDHAQVTSKKQTASIGRPGINVTKSDSKAASKAAQRAAFRTAVSRQAKDAKPLNEHGTEMDVPGTNTSGKRKVGSENDSTTFKCARSADIGGLKANWRKVAPVQAPAKVYHTPTFKSMATSTTTTITTIGKRSNSNLEAAGEFDKDEDVKIIQVVRAKKEMKFPAVSAAIPRLKLSNVTQKPIARSTMQMGIKFEPAEISITGEKAFLPDLCDWAGTLGEPFGSNSHPDLHEVVLNLWRKHFPHLINVENDLAIVGVAIAALRNWLSKIGKAGLRVVMEQIKGLTTEEVIDYVAFKLPADAGTSQCLAIDLLLETFACHVGTTMNVKDSVDYPIGVLALSAASVERALRRWETGAFQDLAFSDSLWGAVTEGYARSTATLNEQKWNDILSGALQFATSSKQQEFVGEMAGQEPSFEMDPRAMITD